MALRTTAQSGGAPAGGGAFRTDLEAMDSAVQYVRQVGETMTSRVARMHAELEAELNAGTWQGEAAQAYSTLKEELGAAHRELIGVLDDIATKVHGNRTGYHQTDQDNRAGFTKVLGA